MRLFGDHTFWQVTSTRRPVARGSGSASRLDRRKVGRGLRHVLLQSILCLLPVIVYIERHRLSVTAASSRVVKSRTRFAPRVSEHKVPPAFALRFSRPSLLLSYHRIQTLASLGLGPVRPVRIQTLIFTENGRQMPETESMQRHRRLLTQHWEGHSASNHMLNTAHTCSRCRVRREAKRKPESEGRRDNNGPYPRAGPSSTKSKERNPRSQSRIASSALALNQKPRQPERRR